MKNTYRLPGILLLFAIVQGAALPAQTYTCDHFNRLTQVAYPDGATAVYGTTAGKSLGIGKRGLWGGDANVNRQSSCTPIPAACSAAVT